MTSFTKELEALFDKRIMVKTDEGDAVWGRIVPLDVYHIVVGAEALITRLTTEARIDEQELTAQNLPHCGGDMCMSCHFVNDYQKARITELQASLNKEGNQDG